MKLKGITLCTNIRCVLFSTSSWLLNCLLPFPFRTRLAPLPDQSPSPQQGPGLADGPGGLSWRGGGGGGGTLHSKY